MEKIRVPDAAISKVLARVRAHTVGHRLGFENYSDYRTSVRLGGYGRVLRILPRPTRRRLGLPNWCVLKRDRGGKR